MYKCVTVANIKSDYIIEKCLGYEVEQSNYIRMIDWYEKYLSDDQVVYTMVGNRL